MLSAAHTEDRVRAGDARTPAPVGGSTAGSGVTTAVLVATAPADEGGPAAGLAWEGGTVLGRLLAQLADLGIRQAHVVTRPEFEQALGAAVAQAPLDARLHASPDAGADARLVAGLARDVPGGLVVAYGDVVTHREALAGLLADPRIATGILTGARRRPLAFRIRSARGRVVSASSPHHAVHRSNLTFLGVLKVSPRDRAALASAASALADLLDGGLPPGWEAELQRKADRWRAGPDAAGGDDGGTSVSLEPAEPEVAATSHDADTRPAAPADEAEVGRRLAIVREDVVAMLLTALVRSGAHLTTGYLRALYWARPVSGAEVAQAAEELTGYDEDKVLLDSAVKATDGFFTTFFVSPYSKYLARFAARRGWTPNAITTASLLIGILAAVAFATGERVGMVVGAVLVQLAFTTDCVDGQLARYTRQFSKLGAWLDSVFDRAKEYIVYAGLAIGAAAQGDDVWMLAGAALTLQTARHMFDFSYAASQHGKISATVQPPLHEPSDRPGGPAPAPVPGAAGAVAPAVEPEPPRRPTVRELPALALRGWRRFDKVPALAWVKRMVAFPIGERFAAISITAAFFDARVTFIVILAWAGFAAAYTLTGRLLRTFS